MDLIARKQRTTLMVGALGALVYANTLGHGFVLDDIIVIVRNQYVQAGLSGLDEIFLHDTFSGFDRIAGQENTLAGGRYRPLSLALFALVGSMVGFAPWIFHGLSILAYAIVCGLAYRIMRDMLAESADGTQIALVTAVLFAVHPLHTEVVANVKGMDELLAMGLALAALTCLWRARMSGRWVDLAAAGFLTFMACLAKEVAFMLVILAPMGLRAFTSLKLLDIARRTFPVWLGAAGYLLLRFSVVGLSNSACVPDPLNDPYLAWSEAGWIPVPDAQWAATVIHVIVREIGLLVWPLGLTHDYYPWAVSLRTFAEPTVWVSLLLLLGLGGWALRPGRWADPVAFGILWFLVALLPTSNLLINTGTFMAERFLFMPSLGGLLAVSSILVGAHRRFAPARMMWILLGVLSLALGALTWSRNADWRSNDALLRSAARHSTGSAKWQNDIGTLLLDSALVLPEGAQRTATLDTALRHLVTATTWHPTYFDAWLAQGACAYYTGDYALSVKAYRMAATIVPGEPGAKTGLLYALRAQGADLFRKGQSDEAVPILRQAWQMQPDTATGALLWTIHEAVGLPDSASTWLARTQALAPDDPRLREWVRSRRPGH